MSKKKYETITDLPEDLKRPLFGEPYERIHGKKLAFSLGHAHWDFIVSLFLFACLSSLLTGDYRGRDFYFAPFAGSFLVFFISWLRHKMDFNRKDAEWDQYCKGYLERINQEN